MSRTKPLNKSYSQSSKKLEFEYLSIFKIKEESRFKIEEESIFKVEEE